MVGTHGKNTLESRVRLNRTSLYSKEKGRKTKGEKKQQENVV